MRPGDAARVAQDAAAGGVMDARTMRRLCALRPEDAEGFLRGVRTLFFCVGAQKAGTTWLYEQLVGHPEMHLAHKEFHYWSGVRSPFVRKARLPAPGRAARIRGGLAAAFGKGTEGPVDREAFFVNGPDNHAIYAKALTDGRGEKPVVGDMTPAYALCGQATFAEMARLHPDTRFLFVMRDPVDRLWSAIRHRYRGLLGAGGDGAFLLRAFDAAVADRDDPDFRRSDYVRTIRRLEAAAPPARIMLAFYEDLFDRGEVGRIARFLGVAAPAAISRERVFAGAPAALAPSPAQRQAARARLAETYDALRARLGERLPRAWLGDVLADGGARAEAGGPLDAGAGARAGEAEVAL